MIKLFLLLFYILGILIGPLTLFTWIRGKIVGKAYPKIYLIIGILCSIVSIFMIFSLIYIFSGDRTLSSIVQELIIS